jgi:hypothetical protein
VAFALGIALLGVSIGFAWWTTPATALAGKAARSGSLGDWAVADQLAQQARALDPARPEYQFLEGLTAAHMGDNARALANLSAFAAFTDTPEAWVNVAALRLRAGDVFGAQEALARGSRLGLQHPALAIAISDLALSAGDTALAVTASSAAVVVTPSLIGDPWWSSTDARDAIYADVLSRSRELAGPDARWEIELMSGNPQGAESAASNASDPSLVRDVIAAWGGDKEAADAVLARCDAEPLDSPIGWCSRIAVRIGRPNDAARYAHLGVLLHIDPDTAGELRIYAALLLRSSAGGISSKAGGSWRQPVLWDVLIPGVVRVADPLGQLTAPYLTEG